MYIQHDANAAWRKMLDAQAVKRLPVPAAGPALEVSTSCHVNYRHAPTRVNRVVSTAQIKSALGKADAVVETGHRHTL